MTRIIKYPAIFTGSGIIYGGLELAFRGRTHWSMLLCGGVCGVLLYLIAVGSGETLWKKGIMGGAVITAVEFVAGSVVNIGCGWNVWSYAHRSLNLFGQICPLFSFLWILLSMPAIGLFGVVEKKIFSRSAR